MALAENIEPGLRAVGVPPADMRAVWPYVEKYFQSFEDRSRGELVKEELLYQVCQGLRQCWIVTDGDVVKACALTEVLEVPTKTVLLNFCAGEDAGDWWAELVDAVEVWAREIGSKRVRTMNRTGWTPRLKSVGYRETHRVMEKEISDG